MTALFFEYILRSSCEHILGQWWSVSGPPTGLYNGGSIYKPALLRGISDSSGQLIRMSSSLLVTLALLSVNVSCLPGPDPGAYYFSKTVWTRDKDAPSHNLKIGEIQILMVGSFFISIEFESEP